MFHVHFKPKKNSNKEHKQELLVFMLPLLGCSNARIRIIFFNLYKKLTEVFGKISGFLM